MGTPLTSATVASTYQALLKTSTNAALSALTMRRISDGLGNDTTIYVGLKDFNNRGSGNIQQNTAIGENALISNTTGNGNVAIGLLSLSSVTTGESNTSVGGQSQQNATGSNNTSLGYQSLFSASGTYNIAIGVGAAPSALGSRNTVIGNESCVSATGSDNIVIGHQADSKTFSNCLLIGQGAQATGNFQVVIGDSGSPLGTMGFLETITPDTTWTVRINGANYKIPMLQI